MKNVFSKISTNKKQIITRTLIVAGAVVGVIFASGLIKVVPTEKTVKVAEAVANAAKTAVE